jgi:hypothetical protein
MRLDGWCLRRRRGANPTDGRNEHRNEYDVSPDFSPGI